MCVCHVASRTRGWDFTFPTGELIKSQKAKTLTYAWKHAEKHIFYLTERLLACLMWHKEIVLFVIMHLEEHLGNYPIWAVHVSAHDETSDYFHPHNSLPCSADIYYRNNGW
jgi:hypothetical protein